jgi:hypothetical protein
MNRFVQLGFVVSVAAVPAISVQAAPVAYEAVYRDSAAQTQTMVQLEAGRTTAIDFSAAQERIVYVNLADPSRVVYTANAPIQSGQASTLFLTPIQKLRFPGATTNNLTNLQVQTADAAGRRRLYTFNLMHVLNARYAGIVVTPYQEKPKRVRRTATRTLPNLSVDAIERGLQVALKRQYTTPDDPVVGKVRRVITQMRQGVSLRRAMRETKVQLSVLKSLAELGATPTPTLLQPGPTVLPISVSGGK